VNCEGNSDPVPVRFILIFRIQQNTRIEMKSSNELRMLTIVGEVSSLSHRNKNFLLQDNTSRRISRLRSRLLAIAINSLVAFRYTSYRMERFIYILVAKIKSEKLSRVKCISIFRLFLNSKLSI